MPVPGEAPCADASITAPTDDSTEALHTADAEVPDGMLNDSVEVSTTVVGGMEETEGLSEGVTDVEELIVGDSLDERLIEAVTVLESDTDDDTVSDTVNDGDDVKDADALTDDDTLTLEDTELATLDEMDDVELTDDDTLTLDDALDEGDVE